MFSDTPLMYIFIKSFSVIICYNVNIELRERILTMSEWIYLNEKTDSIKYLCQKDKRLAKLISMIGSITYQTHDNSFSFLVHEINRANAIHKGRSKNFEPFIGSL